MRGQAHLRQQETGNHGPDEVAAGVVDVRGVAAENRYHHGDSGHTEQRSRGTQPRHVVKTQPQIQDGRPQGKARAHRESQQQEKSPGRGQKTDCFPFLPLPQILRQPVVYRPTHTQVTQTTQRSELQE